MFRFLSIFKKNEEERIDDNEYELVETSGPGKDIVENGMSSTIKPDIPLPKPLAITKPSPEVVALQQRGERAKINEVRDELRDISDIKGALLGEKNKNTVPPSEEKSDMKKVDSPWFSTGPITEDEKTEKVTQFGFDMASSIPDQGGSNAQFRTENGAATITAYFPTDIRSKLSELSPEKRELFEVSADGKSVTYPKSNKELAGEAPSIEGKQPALERGGGPLLMDETKRSFPESKRNAEKVTPEQVAEMIRTTPPDKLVMYTGAGISKGQVPDMGELKDSLHVNGNTEDFLQALLTDPEALAKAFTTFQDKMNTAATTPAHEAIKEIMEAKPDATLMTQNSDKIHERSGIRPIHMAALPEFYAFLKERTDKASLIVVAGLNGDDLGFLQWATTLNPNVQIVAIDLGKEVAKYPTFLNKDNYILPGDAQETLSEVAALLAPKNNEFDYL